MKKLSIELNLNDIVEDMFADAEVCEYGGSSPSQSFSEAVNSEVVSLVSRSLISEISKSTIDDARKSSANIASKFIDSELEGIIIRKLRAGELLTNNYGFKSFDDLIADRISRFNIDSLIRKHIENKTNEFAQEMRVKYDNIFAAKVVQGLAKQKMLDPNVAKMLLGED